jgi:hypothetical protein
MDGVDAGQAIFDYHIQVVSRKGISSTVASVESFLYENGTCTNEKVNETYKQILNTNGTGYDFLKFTELQYNPGSNNPSI